MDMRKKIRLDLDILKSFFINIHKSNFWIFKNQIERRLRCRFAMYMYLLFMDSIHSILGYSLFILRIYNIHLDFGCPYFYEYLQ